MKVVWICHFSNEKVRKHLNIKKGFDFAPWITLSIEIFEKIENVQLHIVAPHFGLKKNVFYNENSINYNFIKTGIPFIRRNWPRFFKYDYWTNYHGYSKKIEKIVRRINPDIINLHGAENPYYSISILRLTDFPVMINVQGIFSSIMAGKLKTKYDIYRSTVENKIYSHFKYFGIRADFMKKYILSLNPNALFFQQFYPIKNTFDFDIEKVKKEYDIVFFARIVKEKGIEDLILALNILKKKHADIKLCIIGSGDSEYINYLKNFINEYQLKNNIIFKGLLKTQSEVHNEAVKAKLSVLPTYNDTIPGTIIESMFLGLPVISYPVGGIPSLNRDLAIITLAHKGDVNDLAIKIETLLRDSNKIAEISIKGIQTAQKYFDNNIVVRQLIQYYNTILKEHEYKKSIIR